MAHYRSNLRNSGASEVRAFDVVVTQLHSKPHRGCYNFDFIDKRP